MKSTTEIVEQLFEKRERFSRVMPSFKKAASICTGLQRKFGIEYPSYQANRRKRWIEKAVADTKYFHFYYDGFSKRMTVEFTDHGKEKEK